MLVVVDAPHFYAAIPDQFGLQGIGAIAALLATLAVQAPQAGIDVGRCSVVVRQCRAGEQ